MKKVFALFLFLVFSMKIHAQITGVKFQLTYDTTSCDYLVSIHITEGQVNKIQDAYHLGFYATLVTEGESNITVKESYNPYRPNVEPKIPNTFFVYGDIASCFAKYNKKMYSIISDLSPSTFYGLQVKAGDVIPLFKFTLDIESEKCGKGVRFYDPKIDPVVGENCLAGADPGNFSIYIGGPNNLYKGNVTQTALQPSPIFLEGTQQDTLLLINGSHLLSNCQWPAEYVWTDEAGNILDTTLNLVIKKQQVENQVIYLIATDALGCKNYISYSTNDTIGYAAVDTVCSGTEIVITPKTVYQDGVWTIDSNHIEGITIVNQANGKATLSISENAEGSFRFFFTQGHLMEEKILWVAKPPRILEALDMVCEKDTLTLPLTGNWKSENPEVAEIVDFSKVVAHKAGTTLLYWEDAVTGCLSNGVEFKSHKNPVISYFGPSDICKGSTGQIWPQQGGIWESSMPSILTITNAGIFTALNPGSADLYFTDLESNCKSVTPVTINVVAVDSIQLNGKDTICIGQTTHFTSSPTYGFWVTDDPVVATIDSQGVVTGLSEGICRIYKFSHISGCTSNSIPILVLPEDQCDQDSLLKLQIVAYSDVDDDDMYTQGTDFLLPNIGISIEGSGMIRYTDQNGSTTWNKIGSTYQFIAEAPYGSWENSTTNFTWTLANDTILYIRFRPVSGPPSAYADITSGFIRCNRYVPFKAIVKNEGSTPFTGKFHLKPEARTFMRKLVPAPIEHNDTLWTWEINKLSPGSNFEISFESFIPIPEVPDDQLAYGYTLVNDSEQVIAQNQLAHLIRCSYDPNDLQVTPDRPGDENFVLRDETIFYKIRFQNTGNDTAFYVRIDDVLDASINRKSLILSDASHPCKMFLCSNDTLCFVFDPIELTDSTTHFDMSHGYVVFKSRLEDSIVHNTQIYNQAHIVFDGNKAISTNTVNNTLVDALPCPENGLELYDDGLLAAELGLGYEWIDCDKQEVVAVTEGPFYKPETNGSYQVRIKGTFCTILSDCVTFHSSQTHDQVSSILQIFPNPARQYFMLQTEESCLGFVLYDVTGKVLTPHYERISNTVLKVDSQHIQSGFYLLIANTNAGSIVKSIIIQN